MAYDPIMQLQALPQPPTLRPGQDAWAVRLLRRVLSARGYGDPAWADPALAPNVSADFDADLETLTRSFQRDHQLAVDGIVGPQTWAALSGSATGPAPGKTSKLRETIVRIAKGLFYLGVEEHGGNNRGVVVEAMLKHAGGRPGQPWCCAFVDFVYEWACEMCGVQPLLDPGLSCSALVRQARQKGLLLEDHSKVQPGDLLVLKGGPTGYKHIGIIQSFSDGFDSAITIEGNTLDSNKHGIEGITSKNRKFAPGDCCCMIGVAI